MSHNRVRPSCGPYATQSETPKESVRPCPRELTGENSPHYTYQPTKMKTDRVPAEYFFASTEMQQSTRLNSWRRQEQRLMGRRDRVAGEFRCPMLGNAAEAVEQALDAMPDRYGRMAVATREFRARDSFELELSQ